jgi:hypothetical protein
VQVGEEPVGSLVAGFAIPSGCRDNGRTIPCPPMAEVALMMQPTAIGAVGAYGDGGRVNPDKEPDSCLPGLGLGEADVVEKGVNVAGAIENADNLDAIREWRIKNKQPRKTVDVPSPNVGKDRMLEAQEGSDLWHPGELCKSMLGLGNEAQRYLDAGFGEIKSGQFLDVPGGKDGLFNTLRHHRRGRRTLAAWREVLARMPV